MELKVINSSYHTGFKNSAEKHLRGCNLLTAMQDNSLFLLERLHSSVPAITSGKDCSELSFGCRGFLKTNTLCEYNKFILCNC